MVLKEKYIEYSKRFQYFNQKEISLHGYIEKITQHSIQNMLATKDKVNLDFELLSEIMGHVNIYEFATYIQSMDYNDFLKTNYWNSIAIHMKNNNRRCYECGSKDDLVVHHMTYLNHGYEHLFLDDLVVLCSFCHNEIHKDNK